MTLVFTLSQKLSNVSSAVGRRCKLDPALKAPCFQTLIVKMITVLFQHEPLVCLSCLRHYTAGAGYALHELGDQVGGRADYYYAPL